MNNFRPLFRRRTCAMTLVELLSAFFLTVAALGVGFLILSAAMDTLTQVRTKQQTSAEARVAIERISREVMAARTIDVGPTALTLDEFTVWPVATLDSRSVLLHGTSDVLKTATTQQIAADHISGLSLTQADTHTTVALTLSHTTKPFKLAKTIQTWANTIP